MFAKRHAWIGAVIGVMLGASSSLFGQSAGAILGTVTDASGALIPGVEVTATDQGTNQSRSVVTNETGNYRIEPLQVGIYSVSAELVGFRKEIRKDLKLDLDARLRVDFRLEVGAVNEVVEVTGAAPVVQTDTSQVGQVVEERKIIELPLNGRSFSALAYVTPGTFAPRPGSSLSERGGFAAVGIAEAENTFLLDGVITNSPQTPEPGVRMNLDAVAEFKVQTQNYAASYGHQAGAHVDAVLKSGTNEIHGALFGFGHSNRLDARNFFEVEKAGYKRTQFGGVVGGPIVRDKVFFFFGYQQQFQDKIHSANPAVPLPEYWEGNLSKLNKTIRDPLTGQPFPNSQIPKARIHPVSLALRSVWDTATLVSNTPGRNARTSFGEPENYVLPNIKINYNISPRHQLIGSYTFWNHTKFLEWNHAQRPELPGLQECCGLRDNLISIQDVFTVSPTFINEFRIGYPRNRRIRHPEQNARNYTKEMGILGTSADIDPVFWGLPSFTVTGYANGPRAGTLQNRSEGYWTVANVVSLQRGNHALKIGGDAFRAYLSPELYYDNMTGTFSFNGSATGDSFADFLLGYLDTSLRSPPTPGTSLAFYQGNWAYSLFVQDDWKATSNLTINIGLRYDLVMPQTDKYDRIATFDPRIGNGRGGIRIQRNTMKRYSEGIELYKRSYPGLLFEESDARNAVDKTDFGPRFGFAWTPGGGTQTVVRGGYGLFYSAHDIGSQTVANEAPFTLSQRFTRAQGATWDNPWPGSGLGAIVKAGEEYYFQSPYYGHWNFGVQRELPYGIVVDAAYVGKKGTHIERSRDINQPIGGVKPYPLFGVISYAEYRGSSIYHGLQSRVERRSASGASILVSYQWGRMISDGGAIRNVYDLRAERGLDAEDVRHRFSSSFVLPLPGAGLKSWLGHLIGGWEMSGIVRMNTGSALTPTVSQDYSGSTRRADRPNLVGNPDKGSDATPNSWWNKAAFTLPERGTYGNAGPGVLEGPGYVGADMGLMKRFAVAEGKTLQFRWEVFNVFNHTNFSTPNTVFDSATFGTTGVALDSRQMQAALKFMF